MRLQSCDCGVMVENLVMMMLSFSFFLFLFIFHFLSFIKNIQINETKYLHLMW